MATGMVGAVTIFAGYVASNIASIDLDGGNFMSGTLRTLG